MQHMFVLRNHAPNANIQCEATPDGAAAGAASIVMPPPPPSQSPRGMGTLGPHKPFTRSRWAVWQDELGRRWRITGLAVEGDLAHACWTVIEPDPAIEYILNERLGTYMPALSTRASGRRN